MIILTSSKSGQETKTKQKKTETSVVLNKQEFLGLFTELSEIKDNINLEQQLYYDLSYVNHEDYHSLITKISKLDLQTKAQPSGKFNHSAAFNQEFFTFFSKYFNEQFSNLDFYNQNKNEIFICRSCDKKEAGKDLFSYSFKIVIESHSIVFSFANTKYFLLFKTIEIPERFNKKTKMLLGPIVLIDQAAALFNKVDIKYKNNSAFLSVPFFGKNFDDLVNLLKKKTMASKMNGFGTVKNPEEAFKISLINSIYSHISQTSFKLQEKLLTGFVVNKSEQNSDFSKISDIEKENKFKDLLNFKNFDTSKNLQEFIKDKTEKDGHFFSGTVFSSIFFILLSIINQNSIDEIDESLDKTDFFVDKKEEDQFEEDKENDPKSDQANLIS